MAEWPFVPPAVDTTVAVSLAPQDAETLEHASYPMNLPYAVRAASPFSVVSVEFVSGVVRVHFSRGAVDNQALRNIGNYVLTTSAPGAVTPTVLAVVPEVADPPTYVDLSVTELTDGARYACEVQTVRGV